MGAMSRNDRRPHSGKIAQAAREPFGNVLPSYDQPSELLQLLKPDRRLDFSETEVVADHVAQIRHSLVTDHGFRVIPNQTESFRKIVVLRDENAALTRMDVLMVVEAVTTDIGTRAGILPLKPRPWRLSRIGNDLQSTRAGDVH